MLAVRGTYDGKEIQIPDDAKDILPCKVIVLFDDDDLAMDNDWLGIREEALTRAWEEEEEALYSKL